MFACPIDKDRISKPQIGKSQDKGEFSERLTSNERPRELWLNENDTSKTQIEVIK